MDSHHDHLQVELQSAGTQWIPGFGELKGESAMAQRNTSLTLIEKLSSHISIGIPTP
jgi:hypothetical protein